ncbi:MAG TPA: hypothetical protein P5307_16550 [Pirellulaceae bacterium]|nr:hypothetical protein [Pirellulaceae bacterium]
MSPIPRILWLAACSFSLIVLALAGCGGDVPDQPAKLTPDQEQEILKQVEAASSGERSGTR